MKRHCSQVIDHPYAGRLEMILSECSYNMACDWLDKERKKWDGIVEICRAFYNDKTRLHEIWTAKWDDTINNYKPYRHFYYDEERGYLMAL